MHLTLTTSLQGILRNKCPVLVFTSLHTGHQAPFLLPAHRRSEGANGWIYRVARARVNSAPSFSQYVPATGQA